MSDSANACPACEGTGDMFGGFACDHCGGSGIQPATPQEIIDELVAACKLVVRSFDALPMDNAARVANLNINALRALIAKTGGAS